jgi:hypothetical protein
MINDDYELVKQEDDIYTAPPAQPAPVQQKPLFADIIAKHPGLAEELKAMDAAPVQEPVAKVDANDEGYWADILPDRTVKVGQLLYTAPPAQPAAWVGLMRGVRVDGDTVVISTKNNYAARHLCALLLYQKGDTP